MPLLSISVTREILSQLLAPEAALLLELVQQPETGLVGLGAKSEDVGLMAADVVRCSPRPEGWAAGRLLRQRASAAQEQVLSRIELFE